MSTTLLKFEVYMTYPQRFDPSYTTFLAALEALVSTIHYFMEATIASDGTNGQGVTLYGLLNPSDGATALSALAAYNTALLLNSLGTVRCIDYTVTTQP
jgi:hypothetical protein